MSLFCIGSRCSVSGFLIYLLSDLQRPLTQRLCFLVLPSLPVQHSQVVEGGGHLKDTIKTLYRTKKSSISLTFTTHFHPCVQHVQWLCNQSLSPVTAGWHRWSGEWGSESLKKKKVWWLIVSGNLIQIVCVVRNPQHVQKRDCGGVLRSPQISDADQDLVAMWTPVGGRTRKKGEWGGEESRQEDEEVERSDRGEKERRKELSLVFLV